jgi:hypothetical protein
MNITFKSCFLASISAPCEQELQPHEAVPMKYASCFWDWSLAKPYMEEYRFFDCEKLRNRFISGD